MSIQPDRADLRPRIATAGDAERLVAAALEALTALEPIVEEETQALRGGLIKDALGYADAKAEAAKRYLTLIETLKTNAIALGRFKPQGLELLKRRHQQFGEILAMNAAVLTTARTVSESILREVSAEVSGSLNPQGYSARGQATSAYTAQAKPLSISKTL